MWPCASRVPEKVGSGAETTQLFPSTGVRYANYLYWCLLREHNDCQWDDGLGPDDGDRFVETANPTGESPNGSG